MIGILLCGAALGAIGALTLVAAKALGPDARAAAIALGSAAGIASVGLVTFTGVDGFAAVLPVPVATLAFHAGGLMGLFEVDGP